MREVQTPRRRLNAATAAAFYVVSSFLLLYPVLHTPVVADDFLNPFSEAVDGGPGLFDVLGHAWRAATDGSSFRPIGTMTGSLFNWFWLATSATFDVSMSTLYSLAKFVLLIACAASVARFWFCASREHGGGIRYWDALVLTSLALFGTLQVHALWSNDPVASYPLAGYGAAVLGFAVLTSAILCDRLRTWRSAATGAALGVVAVLYYELNVGAVIGCGVILVGGVLLRREDRRAALLQVARSAVFVGVPAVVILAGRAFTSGQQGTYQGTDVRTSGAPRAFLLGVGGVIPGSAWRLSNRMLGGRVGMAFFVFVLVVFIAWMMRWWSQGYVAPGRRVDRAARLGQLTVCLAVLTYGAFAIALPSITIKIQDDMKELGYVYTFYAIGSCCVALAIAVAGRALLRLERGDSLRFLGFSVALIFVVVQSTINWRLSDRLNADLVNNHRLLDTFDGDVPEIKRCAAFEAWSVAPWPDYYRDGMRDGLQETYERYFDEPFCTSLQSVQD